MYLQKKPTLSLERYIQTYLLRLSHLTNVDCFFPHNLFFFSILPTFATQQSRSLWFIKLLSSVFVKGKTPDRQFQNKVKSLNQKFKSINETVFDLNGNLNGNLNQKLFQLHWH